jgi:hypothetical protein
MYRLLPNRVAVVSQAPVVSLALHVPSPQTRGTAIPLAWPITPAGAGAAGHAATSALRDPCCPQYQ